MKKKQLFGMLLMALTIGIGFTSCEKDDGLGDTDVEDTFGDVEDTFGIEVNLGNQNNGGGSVTVLSYGFLGDHEAYITIDGNNNFYCIGQIVSVGHVSGLSKVNDIPSSGWSTTVSVKACNGYIIRGKATDGNYHYARVYVVDQLTGAGSGGIIGATIRYQPDWK